MSTQHHIDALQQAIAEARANMHEMNRCDWAVTELINKTTPWVVRNCCRESMKNILRDPALRVIDVDKRWSWSLMMNVYDVWVVEV